MAEVLRFRGTSARARQLLRELPAVLSGRAADPFGVAPGVLLRGGVALLSKIQQSFLALSRTGSDPVTGIAWPPLSPKTIAARRATAGERKQLGIRDGKKRPSLTDAQDRRWRGVYGQRLAWLRAQGVGDLEAKGRAAAAAWAALKAAGAKTKLELLGSRKVDILRDTSALFRSLTPGVEDAPSQAADQILAAAPGRVTVGTRVPYATAHHEGVPGRLPRRRLWPTGGDLPPAWRRAVADALARGLVRAVARMLG